jgi:hypothetical protein
LGMQSTLNTVVPGDLGPRSRQLAIVEAFVPGGSPRSVEEFWTQITLCCKSLKTEGEFRWLGVRDDFRTWFVQIAA